jgi:PAS domain S-box-containing protein
MFKNFKISTKIILPIIIITTIVLSAATIYSYFFNTKNLEIVINSHLETATQSRANHVKTVIKMYEQRARMLTSKTWLRKHLKSYYETNGEEYKTIIEEILVDLKLENPEFLHISIINPDGKVVVSSHKDFVGKDFSNKDFFINGKKDYTVSDYHEPEYDGSRLHIAGPLTQDGEFLGVVAVSSDGKTMESVMTEYSGLGETGQIYLINKEGYMITPSRFKEDTFLKEKVDTLNARNCFSGAVLKDIAKYKDYRGSFVLGTYQYIPEMQWCLLAEIDESEILAPARDLLKFSIIRVLVVLTIFFIVTLLLAKMISKPIIALHHGIEIIEKGNLDHKVATTSKDEIGQLSRAFDQMTLAIKQSRAEVDQKVVKQTEEITKKSIDLANQQKAVLNILEDVQEEKQKSINLAHDLKKFQLAVANSSEHIVITDSEGIILYANQAVQTITGFSPQEIIGNKVGTKENWGGLMDKATYQNLWQTVKTSKKPFTGEINNKKKTGEKYIAQANIVPILNNQQQVAFFVGIERDITKAKEIDRMKTEFISLASHQLRTPLSAMKWFLEMLLHGDAGELSKEQTEYITNIDQSNERMIALVNALLNISRIESGRIIIDPELTNLEELVKTVTTELKPKLEAKKQNIIVSAHHSLPKINLDPKLIRNVYQNLLTNAIKYSPAESDITIMISKKDDQIISQISDSGAGIPIKEQTKVFQKFYRGENIVKLETDGNGLGLYLVKAVIESSGGKIWFKSEEKKGTTFWFSLPLKGVKPKKGQVTIDS